MKTKKETKHELLVVIGDWYIGNMLWKDLNSKIDSLLDELLEWKKISRKGE